ncbi:MAG: Gfo/Idh/MocA family protein [Planctomycetota bacterium]|jgi:predicted dehydrogenase
MKGITRRAFIKGSVAAGMALALPHSRVLGANDDIRVAVVGFRGQGGGHIKRFLEIPGVRVVALCDVDEKVIAGQVKKFQDRNEQVDTYTDVRKLLEDKNIDAISTATPNHWHALITIWACQAGKDVYVEKPVSHNIWEGRQMVEAARKYDRIVQTGTQSRSSGALHDAFEYIWSGNLGEIVVARGFCYKRRRSIGKVTGIQPIPESVDYNLWTGPAPLEPLTRRRLHYDWHWVWPTGSGDLGNQGIHQMDVCRWAIRQNKLAPSVMSIGGRFGYDDDGTTANTQIAVLAYEPAPIIFEVRGLPNKRGADGMDYYKTTRIGVVIECKDGYHVADASGKGWSYDKQGNRIKQFSRPGAGDHQKNFIDAVRSHKVSDLNADILEGHLSSSLCHMANISYRLGQRTDPKVIQEQLKNQPKTLDAFRRFEDHLFNNWVDVSKDNPILGPSLEMNPETETFVGDGEYSTSRWANEMLRRQYRSPYVVPEKV